MDDGGEGVVDGGDGVGHGEGGIGWVSGWVRLISGRMVVDEEKGEGGRERGKRKVENGGDVSRAHDERRSRVSLGLKSGKIH